MKALFNNSRHIPAALLLAEVSYLAFVPSLSIAHSIIVFSLAGLFAFNQFLLSKETPSLSIELSKLQSELEQQIQKQKETYEARLKLAEDEIGRISMLSLKSSSAPSKADTKPKYIF